MQRIKPLAITNKVIKEKKSNNNQENRHKFTCPS